MTRSSSSSRSSSSIGMGGNMTPPPATARPGPRLRPTQPPVSPLCFLPQPLLALPFM